MQRIYYDIIYLAACGVNGVRPSDALIQELKRKEQRTEKRAEKSMQRKHAEKDTEKHAENDIANQAEQNAEQTIKEKTGEKKENSEKKTEQEVPYMEMLYRMSRAHFMDALVGTVLQQAGITLPKKWTERISKAVRKNLLFDVERKKLLDFMEQKGIWYMPLKGVILKDYYPAVGMRQMSDNDILFDNSFCDEIEQYMKSQGYEAVSVGAGNHDVYEKKPVYNFEMHRALYGEGHDRKWEAYYRDVKKRLIQDSSSSYGYHFGDEDFYVYILCHAYKHYTGGGTGLRSLLDFYVYLTAKEQSLDFAYISRECAVLGIGDFEKQSRSLCRKVFSVRDAYNMEAFEESLSPEEMEMLRFYLSSGAYGTMENYVSNMVKKKGKVRFLMSRIFMPLHEIKKVYPILCHIPVLLPVCWVVRGFEIALTEERRKNALSQLRAFVKVVRKSFKADKKGT